MPFESERPEMEMMPRLLPQKTERLATISALVLLMLVFLTGIDASAQRRRRPGTVRATPQQQGNANNSAAAQKRPQKTITPLRSNDTNEGSRITIRADAPLNDYSAYRSGDRYYVVIPDANAPGAQS